MKKLLTVLLIGNIISASFSAYAQTESNPLVEFAARYEYDKSGINIITEPKEFSEIQKSKIIANGLIGDYSTQCFSVSEVLFANPDIFKEFGCDVVKDNELNIITISKNDITLEISPNLSAMRKNKEQGYWIPLSTPAGIYEGDTYVPVGEIAEELGLVLSISANYNNDTLIYNLDKFILTPQIALAELKRYGVFTEISHYDFDAVVTRSEACFLLDKIFYSEVPDIKLPFTDIEASSGLYNALANLVSRNIVNGYEDKTFRPKDIVTTEQFAAMLIRATGHSDFESDNDKSPWYLQIMSAAKDIGIMEYVKYKESSQLSYGQAMIMLYNAVNVPIVNKDDTDNNSTLLINFVKDKYNSLLKDLGVAK